MCSAVLWSYAVEEDAPANQDDKMFLEAWLQTHHPDALRHGMGIYIINDLDTPEDGGTAVEKPCYARVTYTIRDLDGTVTTTSDIDIAKQLGEYEEANYYGPRVWAVRDGAVSKGIEDMLLGMVEGCSREAVIPGWLQTYNRYGTEEEYMAKVTGNSPLIYNVKGSRFSLADTPAAPSGNVTVGYLEVPVSLQWGPDLLLFRPFLDVTPFVGYGLNNRFSISGMETVKNSWDGSSVNRWEYGVGVGIGLEIWKFQVIGRYNWNFGSLLDFSKDLGDGGFGPALRNSFERGNFGGFTLTAAILF